MPWNLAFGLIFVLVHSAVAAFYQGNGDIQNEYVRTGTNATLFCQPASDMDNPNRVVWYKEDRKLFEVVNGRKTFSDAGAHVSIQPNNALYFRRVTYQDSGEYYCEVNNKRSRSSLARLLVQDADCWNRSVLEEVNVGLLIIAENGENNQDETLIAFGKNNVYSR